MSLDKYQTKEYRNLKNSGVDVEDTNSIQFNEGSETSPHICVKSLAGLIGLRNGYRVDSEVEVTNQQTENGEIDCLIWGHESRLTYAVEVESSPLPETVDAKLDKYVRHTAIDDMQVLNLNDCPQDMTDALGWVASELGLEP